MIPTNHDLLQGGADAKPVNTLRCAGWLLLLAIYIYHLASRSREAELKQARGKCEIALQGAKHSLDSAAWLHKNEIGRLNATRGGTRESAAKLKVRSRVYSYSIGLMATSVNGNSNRNVQAVSGRTRVN